MLDVAAKQEAFEESVRLKNQFRNLDEDEVEFLDSVLESTRAKEDAVKKETAEQLQAFRRQQEEADKASLSATATGTALSEESARPDAPSGDSQWAINARKRKRAKDNAALPGLKLRKSSSTCEKPARPEAGITDGSDNKVTAEVDRSSQATGDRSKDLPRSDDTRIKNTRLQGSPASPKPTVGVLGLAAYSSDEEA